MRFTPEDIVRIRHEAEVMKDRSNAGQIIHALIQDRDELHHLLATATARAAGAQVRHANELAALAEEIEGSMHHITTNEGRLELGETIDKLRTKAGAA